MRHIGIKLGVGGTKLGDSGIISQEACLLPLGPSIGIIPQGPQRLLLSRGLTRLFDLIRNKEVASYQVVSQNREMKTTLRPLKPTLVTFREVYTAVSNSNHARHTIST